MKPHDVLKAWKPDTAHGRVVACQFLLYVHGFLSDAEKQRVDRRIQEWFDRHTLTKRKRGGKA